MARAAGMWRGVILLVVVGAAVLGGSAGCDERSGSGKRLIKPGAGSGGGQDKVVNVSKDDAAMNGAMAQAKKTVDTFIARVMAPQGGDSGFAVKKKFQYRGNIEFMWVSDVTYTARTQEFVGTLGNDPEGIPNVKLGDRVKVKADEVADWMYISNGKLVGGFTVRALRSKMSPTERAKFDREFGARIE